jgi:hypothetical protein
MDHEDAAHEVTDMETNGAETSSASPAVRRLRTILDAGDAHPLFLPYALDVDHAAQQNLQRLLANPVENTTGDGAAEELDAHALVDAQENQNRPVRADHIDEPDSEDDAPDEFDDGPDDDPLQEQPATAEHEVIDTSHDVANLPAPRRQYYSDFIKDLAKKREESDKKAHQLTTADEIAAFRAGVVRSHDNADADRELSCGRWWTDSRRASRRRTATL